jgi:phosphoglucosamine mutase
MDNGRRLFGTDGIRGEANVDPMTPEIALRMGMAVAAHFGDKGTIVVGKDTRLSGYFLESALASGLCALGADVTFVGPLPTPGIAYIVTSLRAAAGVVISASHNPFHDNGIKLFAADGYKLPDDVEARLEALMEDPGLQTRRARGAAIGRAVRLDDASGRYITHLKQAFSTAHDLDGVKIVVDCAHGSAYRVAPSVFRELGAEVITIGGEPDGVNINQGVGAMHPEVLCAKVRELGADVGLALDGDADRAVLCDEHGNVVDGDAVLAMCAREMHSRGLLKGEAVVATVMSNLGLERALEEVGLGLVRTDVGDRYVVEAMRAGGYNLGGEQSGHLVFLDHATTGDGVVAALQVLNIMRRTGSPLSKLAGVMTRLPQLLRSVSVARKAPIDTVPALARAVREVTDELDGRGRVLVRYSGTENKLRVMLEGDDEPMLAACLDRIVEVALTELGAGA